MKKGQIETNDLINQHPKISKKMDAQWSTKKQNGQGK